MISDPDGLLSLLEMHGAELHALFARLTMRTDVAEDLLQELFLKLRRSGRLIRADNRKAYLFRTAIHLAFDWRRAQRPTVPLRTEPAAPAESSLKRLIDAEELEQILDAMSNLSELNQQVLVLRYLQHLEYTEIAEQLGKTEHQVRGLCHKALGQLRTILRPAASEPQKGGTQE
ncbi:MAG TPA: RNA polymerase sigma factor [Gemmataceae bacterium]|nr:RNA polymerase sigma factor [Gemmataceae bacterium]